MSGAATFSDSPVSDSQIAKIVPSRRCKVVPSFLNFSIWKRCCGDHWCPGGCPTCACSSPEPAHARNETLNNSEVLYLSSGCIPQQRNIPRLPIFAVQGAAAARRRWRRSARPHSPSSRRRSTSALRRRRTGRPGRRRRRRASWCAP